MTLAKNFIQISNILLIFLTVRIRSNPVPDDEEVDESMKNIDDRRFNSIRNLILVKLELAGEFELSNTDVNERLRNYGCYCFNDADRIGGAKTLTGNKGKPLDAMDSLCQDLYRCHRCIYEFDHPTGSCVQYGKYSYDMVENNAVCKDTELCKIAQCNCEVHFAEEIVSLWTESNYIFTRPTVDENVNCKSENKFLGSTDSCCGEPGNRRPYNSNFMQCCDDTTLRSFGEGC